MRQLALIVILLPVVAGHAQDHSAEYTDRWQIYAYELLGESIAFSTVRGQEQVLPFASYLADEFARHGFPAENIRVLPMDSHGEPVAALVVRYPGSTGRRPILFTAHMDVVDAAGENWGRDPFRLTEEDGFFYGRGVLDDKFGTTVLTATFVRLMVEGFVPERDLIIAFTGDEETHMESVKALVRDHRELIDAEFAMNVDAGGGLLSPSFEPVMYALQFAEKTYATFELTTRSPGGHSSKPTRDNAIFHLADAIKALQSYRFPVRDSTEVRAFFTGLGTVLDNELGATMLRFAANPADTAASDRLSDYPEFVGIVRTTCIPTMLRGGHAENALPESATVTINCRIYPGIAVAEVEQQLTEVVNNPELGIRLLGDATASPSSPLRNDVVEIVQKAVDRRFPGTPVIPFLAPYATDGTHLRLGGIPTYGSFGLFMRAEDELSHSSNEKLPVREFFAALDHWYSVIRDLAAL